MAAASTAGKRYAGRFVTAIVVYAVVLVGAIWLLQTAPPPGLLRYVVAGAPALPIIGVLASMALYLKEEPDEFGRAVLVQAMLWALAFILGFTTVWGFIEDLGGAPHFPLYAVFPVFCGAMGVSQLIIRIRYGALP